MHKVRHPYIAWIHIKARCFNGKGADYKYYGGRGITMSDGWKNSFEQFLSDMGPRPSIKHSVDRMDVNGNYEQGNCRWATPEEQARNKRNNKHLTYKGKTMLLTDWAKLLKISHTVILNRIKRGNPIDRVFTSTRFGRTGKPRPMKVKLVISFGSAVMQ